MHEKNKSVKYVWKNRKCALRKPNELKYHADEINAVTQKAAIPQTSYLDTT